MADPAGQAAGLHQPIPPACSRTWWCCPAPEGRHAATVRRLRPGERADLTDGDGMIAECVVAAARPGLLELTVLRRHQEPPPQPRICVVQAIPKGDRGEQAVETMTEVGVDVIVPWAAERCVAVWDAGPAPVAARAGPLAVDRPRGGQAVAPRSHTRGDRAGRDRGCARPGRRGRVPRSSWNPAPAPGSAPCRCPAAGEIIVIVGPEGGVSPAESAAFAAAGAVAARLGPTVLRASTRGRRRRRRAAQPLRPVVTGPRRRRPRDAGQRRVPLASAGAAVARGRLSPPGPGSRSPPPWMRCCRLRTCSSPATWAAWSGWWWWAAARSAP